MGESPSLAGAVNLTVAVVVPVASTALMIGTPGAIAGSVVIVFEIVDGFEVPMAFVAVIEKVYAVPALNPVMSIVPEPD